MIIDFSSYDSFTKCPALWFERYINGWKKKWPKAQRDDALALGSLVHEGLRVWQERKVVEIPESVVEEVTPTAECLNLALELVHGYAMRYPSEVWPLVLCEKPVTFPLWERIMWGCDSCGVEGFDPKDVNPHINCDRHWWDAGKGDKELIGLAKIDAYFYVPDHTQIESGLPGVLLSLTPGWWIHEYKTKSPYIPMGIYMQGWEMGMQASFQTLALRHHLTQDEMLEPEDVPDEVQGVLVNVLEKPKRHIPMRTCNACQEKYEFYTWVPTGTGEYACPTCGKRRKIDAPKQDMPVTPPAYYRFIVTRNEQKLIHHRDQIVKVGREMIEMEQGGLQSKAWHTQNCVDHRWKTSCEYFGPHNSYTTTVEAEGYEPVKDYRGLVEIS